MPQVFYYRIDSNFHEPTSSTTDLSARSFAAWSTEQTRVSVAITNGFEETIELVWSDEANEGVPQGLLAPGETMQLGSFLGHTFYARKRLDTERRCSRTSA